jgi:hypothetical protein
LEDEPMSNTSYNDLTSSYTSQLRNMFAAPAGLDAQAARGDAGQVDSETLAQRAGELADLSASFGEANSGFLDSDSQDLRQAAEVKLLLQASAEFEVALALVDSAEAELRGRKTAPARAADTAASLGTLADFLENPIDAGLAPYLEEITARAAASGSKEEASKALQDQVRRSLRNISRAASQTGSLALDSLFELDAGMLKKAVGPVSKELSELMESIAGGINEKIKALLRSAFRLMLQAYDWVLNLIGKDAEQEARKKVQEWIEELRSSHEKKDDVPDLADQLVSTLFVTQKTLDELGEWLPATTASIEKLDEATNGVLSLADSFHAKTAWVQKFVKLLGSVPESIGTLAAALTIFNPGIAASIAGLLPAVEVVRGGVTMGLLGYTLYTGYDHVDSGRVTFFGRFGVNIPDRVTGVRELVQTTLQAA